MVETVVIYSRVSSRSQADSHDNVSIQTQEIECTNFCRSKGWRIVDSIYDVGSGRDIEKLWGHKELLRLAKSGTMTIILVYNISRFSRNIRQALNMINRLKKFNVSVYSVQEKCSYSTSSDKHSFNISLCFAELDSNIKSDTMKSIYNFLRLRGDYIGTAPYGFSTTKDCNGRRILCPDRSEKEVIQRIEDLRRAGRTFREIANTLNTANISKKGKPWTSSNVRTALKAGHSLSLKSMQRELRSASKSRSSIIANKRTGFR